MVSAASVNYRIWDTLNDLYRSIVLTVKNLKTRVITFEFRNNFFHQGHQFQLISVINQFRHKPDQYFLLTEFSSSQLIYF